MRLPTGLYAGSVNLQELCRAPRAGSWTSRVSSLFHLPPLISPTAIVYHLERYIQIQFSCLVSKYVANLLLAFNHFNMFILFDSNYDRCYFIMENQNSVMREMRIRLQFIYL